MLRDLASSFATAGTLSRLGFSKNLKRGKLLGAFPLTYSATSKVCRKVRCHIWVVDFFEMEARFLENVSSVARFSPPDFRKVQKDDPPISVLLFCSGDGCEANNRGRFSLAAALRSEEHTSELQSQSNLVCR